MAGGRLALDHVTSAALVASCSGASAVQAALELAMSVTSGTPRGMSLNSALRACAARRAWRAAVATFRAARRAHADDALGLAALLSALEGRMQPPLPSLRRLVLRYLVLESKSDSPGSMQPDQAALAATALQLLQLFPHHRVLPYGLKRALATVPAELRALRERSGSITAAPYGVGKLAMLVLLEELQMCEVRHMARGPVARGEAPLGRSKRPTQNGAQRAAVLYVFFAVFHTLTLAR
ncbi:unnamed protein product [Effrenium voratum]|nr:unnamed protein product [Effrenium voratum]